MAHERACIEMSHNGYQVLFRPTRDGCYSCEVFEGDSFIMSSQADSLDWLKQDAFAWIDENAEQCKADAHARDVSAQRQARAKALEYSEQSDTSTSTNQQELF